jgi:FtsP/CotA-like multicopper oxidase with cupredoxin domain
MALSRRRFLAMAAGVAAGSQLARAEQAPDGFTIVRARSVKIDLLADGANRTSAWIFGNGPEPLVIHATQGEELRLRFVNELASEIWLHFFGVRGPSDLMTLNVPAGPANTVDCVFTPPDAGTFWLGPMADVSRLRDMGLYAMLVVGERQPVADLEDVNLVLDDWKLADDGAVQEGFGDIEAMAGEGRLGNWFTVNGLYRPRIALADEKVTRLRLLNAANVRSMGVLFKGDDPLLVALDGQPVQPRALGQGALTLAPGQRADLLVMPEAGVVVALDLFEDISEIAYLVRDGSAATPPLADNFALAANPIAATPDLATARLVPLVIEGGIKGGLKSAMLHGKQVELRALLENGMGWAFNGVAGPGGPPVVAARRGETIVFEVDNRTAFDQPLHVHGHVWRAVGADEGAVPGEPWRDTAVVPARQLLRLVMVADNPGSWAIHSLIAERADGGLLSAFAVAE